MLSRDSWRRRGSDARLSWALARGAATAAAREVDPSDPRSWEFCAFSQNGEDGIIDFLSRRLHQPNRRFLEIGASNGLDNNTAWLAIARRYQGVMIEGRPSRAARARAVMSRHAQGVQVVAMEVDRENAAGISRLSSGLDPDLFSLDIDGNDYHVLDALLTAGFRPRIVVVEYNSAFGPTRAVTIPYTPAFQLSRAHPSRLYYGASVSAWRVLLEGAGFRFVGVDSNGVNAIFIDPLYFEPTFLAELRDGVPFAENCSQRVRFADDWQAQFERIAHLALVDVSAAGRAAP